MALYKAAVVYNRHFFMVSSTDHLSAKTGLTPTVNISKAGAAFGAAAGAVSEIGNGWYRVALTTADTSTTGDLMFHITSATADDTDFADQVVSYDPFDAAALGLSRIDAAVTTRMATFTLPTNFSALSITAGGLADITQTAADKVWSTAARTLTAFGFSVTVGTNNDKTGYALSAAGVQAIWDALTSALTTVGSIGKRISDFLTGDAFVRLGAPAGASTSADIAAAKVDTAAIKVQTDKLTFSVANKIDANIKNVNNVAVNGVGTAGSPWGP